MKKLPPLTRIDFTEIDEIIRDYVRIKRLLQERMQRGFASGWRDGYAGRWKPRGKTREYLGFYELGYKNGQEDRLGVSKA